MNGRRVVQARKHCQELSVRQVAKPGEPFSFGNESFFVRQVAKDFPFELTRTYDLNSLRLSIKPTLIGNETRDILNYASQSSSFPQEFIGDQWFSEEIKDRNTFTDLNEFRDRVSTNLG